MLLVIKLIWYFQRRRQDSEDDDDSSIQKCYWQLNYLGNFNEGNNEVRLMMIEEYRNDIGN